MGEMIGANEESYANHERRRRSLHVHAPRTDPRDPIAFAIAATAIGGLIVTAIGMELAK